MVTLDQIYHASCVLRGVARKTDMIEAAALSGLTDCRLFLKTENLQLTGSFKLRGAYYKISRLTEEQRAAGILACSAGNHAQGVALAASRAGLRAVICMPDGAPMTKVEATKGFGAEVVLVKGGYDDAYAHACRLRDETGMTFIHPFDDPDVIAGQGTIGLEILEQLPDADIVLVPVGGGGLLSGVIRGAEDVLAQPLVAAGGGEHAAQQVPAAVGVGEGVQRAAPICAEALR